MTTINLDNQVSTDFIEITVGEGIKNLKSTQMSKEETGMLINITMSPDDVIDKLYDELSSETHQLKIYEKRLETCLKITVDKRTLIFMMAGLNLSLGFRIMILYYLQYFATKILNDPNKHIDFDLFCMRIFPMGFPSVEDLNTIWSNQKINGANGIDIGKASQSILT